MNKTSKIFVAVGTRFVGSAIINNFIEKGYTNFISVMPTNFYGPNDNFDLEKSHVLSALIKQKTNISSKTFK